jgi:hypothetical protein
MKQKLSIFEVMNFHRNTATPQHRNTATPQHRNTATPQHRNTATPQHRNTAILNIGVNYYSFIFLV